MNNPSSSSSSNTTTTTTSNATTTAPSSTTTATTINNNNNIESATSSSSCSVEGCMTKATENIGKATNYVNAKLVDKRGECITKSTARIENARTFVSDNIVNPVSTTLAQPRSSEYYTHPFDFMTRLTHFIEDNVISLSIGACFGSFITAGIGIGIITATNMIQHTPTIYKWTRYKLYQKFNNNNNSLNHVEKENESSKEGNETSLVSSSNKNLNINNNKNIQSQQKIIYFHAYGSSNCNGKKSIEKDSNNNNEMKLIEDCITTITTQLSNKNMNWNDIQRITLNLTPSIKSSPKIFRDELTKKLTDLSSSKTANDTSSSVMISYVPRLEDPLDCIMMEVMTIIQ